jgi:protoporphyrinogen oxidase
MIEHSHVVIGGGISGLGAHTLPCAAQVKTLVLEHGGRVGGTLHSVYFAACPGF